MELWSICLLRRATWCDLKLALAFGVAIQANIALGVKWWIQCAYNMYINMCCVNMKRTAYSWECIYVYILCVTLCIRSMYNIYTRRRLGMAASLFNKIIAGWRHHMDRYSTLRSLFSICNELYCIIFFETVSDQIMLKSCERGSITN